NHPSKAFGFQTNYGGTGWPFNHSFYMPWQHGALLYGYLGAYRHWADPLLLEICEDVVTSTEYAWITNYQDPEFGFVPNGIRYYVATECNGPPVPANHWDATHGIRCGGSPLGGPSVILVGGMLLLADVTGSQAVRSKALHYGYLLRGGPL